MKWNRLVVIGVVLVLTFVPRTLAQEKPQASPEIPLKVLIVFNEFEGEKKVSSMPYTLSVLSSTDRGLAMASLRMGIKVPILTQSAAKEGQSQIVYQDVGTYIDCRVNRLDDTRYSLNTTVRRSSIYMPPGVSSGKEGTFMAGELSGRPVLQEFSDSFVIIIRDGETKQSAVATDPLTGRQVKVDVTLTVLK
jgi:hypothetical protein